MHQTKIIALLRTFTDADYKTFRKFIRSPYFNTNENVVKLYDYLCRYAPDFKSAKLNRQTVFAHLFADEPFKEIKMQQFGSLLVGLVEQFWVHQAVSQPNKTANLMLADAYRQRGLLPYWQKTLSETNRLSVTDSADEAYCQLQTHVQQHLTTEAQEKREQEPHLQEVLNALGAFFSVSYLKYGSKALNYRRFNPNQNYLLTWADAALHHAQMPEYAQLPALQIYRCIWQTLQQPDEEQHFDQLKTLLFQYHSHFTQPETEEMFVFAHNYCIGKLNKGQQPYLRELFNLYRFEMEHHIINPQKPLSASVYRNIITIAQLLGEWTWMEEFIHNFRQAVGEDTFIFNLARLRFLQKRFEQTIELLQNRHDRFGDVLMLLAAKALFLKALYELFVQDTQGLQNYDDVLAAFVAAFMALLHRRKKELLHHYVYYLNLAQKVRQLLNLLQGVKVQQRALTTLEQSVQKTTEIAEKAWLLEKIAQLKNLNR